MVVRINNVMTSRDGIILLIEEFRSFVYYFTWFYYIRRLLVFYLVKDD